MCKQIWIFLWILPIYQWNELQQLFCIQEYNMKNAKRGFLKMFTVQCTLYTEKPICTIRIKVYFTYIKWHRQWTPKKNRDRPWCSAFQRKRLGFLGSTSADKREARIYLNQGGGKMRLYEMRKKCLLKFVILVISYFSSCFLFLREKRKHLLTDKK